MPIFSENEMSRRLIRFRARMGAERIDAALLHTADHVFYLSGVALLSGWGRPMWSVVTETASIICGAAIHEENIRAHGSVDELLLYNDDEEPTRKCIALCSSVIARNGGLTPRIGIEEAAMPYGTRKALEESIPGAVFVDVSPWLEEMRFIKTAEELSLLKFASDLAKLGADAFIEALDDNVTELAVAAHALAAVDKAMGALSSDAVTSSAVYAQFGGNTMIPHQHPTGRRLKRGDVVTLNIFPAVWGYSSELIRTFVHGGPSERQRQILEVIDRSLDVGKGLLVPGAIMGDVNRGMNEVIARHGFEGGIRCGNGHANGIMIGAAGREERGEVRAYNTNRFAPGVVNTIEPGVYLPEIGGFRQSDLMVLTPTGAECLTDFPLRIGW
ncbi:Xaa-Pro peptidase family protein [Shinella sp. DD12]|uniref:M24 family metallopeptidase n=1 Tax=Shinella sp. DD12 TaxID=1410620 RepID=UPI000437AA54|nr:Xaa-Pro peptidase family protein [Shinella sp. DD12]EYR78185.1 Xaa-Pro aminopeptidase [Shinella sp. DD12]